MSLLMLLVLIELSIYLPRKSKAIKMALKLILAIRLIYSDSSNPTLLTTQESSMPIWKTVLTMETSSWMHTTRFVLLLQPTCSLSSKTTFGEQKTVKQSLQSSNSTQQKRTIRPFLPYSQKL